MLLQFKLKNYKIFKEETILDLRATKQSELNSQIILASNEKILPIAAIYGANASGKSTILEAFSLMKDLVNGNKNITYLLNESLKNDDILFEVFFINQMCDDRIYNYGFTIDEKGISKEWLNYKAKSSRNNFVNLYTRENNDYISKIKGLKKQIVNLESNQLLLTFGLSKGIKELSKIASWFQDDTQDLDVSSALKYAQLIDDSIEKVKLIEGKTYFSHHKMQLSLEEESSGVKRMIDLCPRIDSALKKGSVIVIDDLSNNFHPLIVRKILQMFLDKQVNKNNAQLIFSTFDPWLLNSGILRRDEIWFIDKSANGNAEAYSLADFIDPSGDKIRKDENYEKNYMLGKYGAIPIFDRKDI